MVRTCSRGRRHTGDADAAAVRTCSLHLRLMKRRFGIPAAPGVAAAGDESAGPDVGAGQRHGPSGEIPTISSCRNIPDPADIDGP